MACSSLDLDFPGDTNGKESACQCRRCKRCMLDPGLKDLLEEGKATHSSILAWRIPWTEEPEGYSPGGRKESDMTERLGTLIAGERGMR